VGPAEPANSAAVQARTNRTLFTLAESTPSCEGFR
jgi:hypothetical protein